MPSASRRAATPNQIEFRQVKAGTQKKGVIWKRARKSHKEKQDPIVREIKLADLDMLELVVCQGNFARSDSRV